LSLLYSQVVLLRNRDRLSLLWPPVFDHLCAIIRGKGVEGTLVAAAAVGLLRLCQRLLPCKPEAAEPLLRGLQLVPSLDPEVGVGVHAQLGLSHLSIHQLFEQLEAPMGRSWCPALTQR
jgi:hypothetical protein